MAKDENWYLLSMLHWNASLLNENMSKDFHSFKLTLLVYVKDGCWRILSKHLFAYILADLSTVGTRLWWWCCDVLVAYILAWLFPLVVVTSLCTLRCWFRRWCKFWSGVHCTYIGCFFYSHLQMHQVGTAWLLFHLARYWNSICIDAFTRTRSFHTSSEC